MWRRVYFALMLVRIYLVFWPSYIHPDEQFQGPEVLAGHIFGFPCQKTWEWTSATPIRSVFPLWLFYGLPMALLKWVIGDPGSSAVSPRVLYYALRAVMAMLSLVLEDWAIYELVRSPRRRRQAMVLVASSYVTWTFQSHTFSNSLETLLVLWSFVLIDRILTAPEQPLISCVLLSFLSILGLFNRITYPAFLLIPSVRLFRYLLQRPIPALVTTGSCLLFIVIAISTDTVFYQPEAARSYQALFGTLFRNPSVTPVNNLLYNSQASNLALHGLHPRYQHALVNLPQLLGPGFIFLIWSMFPFGAHSVWSNSTGYYLTSAFSGMILLSLLPHQEPRFLLATIPIFLSCLRLPESSRARRLFWITWAAFNLVMGLLMGIFHQGGVLEIQLGVPNIINSMVHGENMSMDVLSDRPYLRNTTTEATVFWWKTYPPPLYLLGKVAKNPYLDTPIDITTVALMGQPFTELQSTLNLTIEPCTARRPRLRRKLHESQGSPAVLVALPFSSLPPKYPSETSRQRWFPIDTNHWVLRGTDGNQDLEIKASLMARYSQHLNLDDIDFEEDGIGGTVQRVLGKRGIGLWYLERTCP